MENNTLNVSSISEGFVLDHIQAGKSMDIYHYLRLDKLDCCVAIIKNARSNKMGKKDIMKIECPIDIIDLDILGFIDHNITINIIQNDKVVEKKRLELPKEITNVIKCKNPRCITSIEQELEHVFVLTDPEKEVYRCKYCEEKYDRKNSLIEYIFIALDSKRISFVTKRCSSSNDRQKIYCLSARKGAPFFCSIIHNCNYNTNSN